MKIQVCGPGCTKCHETAEIVQEALKETGITADIEKVTDFNAIASLGIFSTPAVIIDGQIKCVGKRPSKKEVLAWLAND